MSSDAEERVSEWMARGLSPGQQVVVRFAEALRDSTPRPWWRRRKPSPINYVDQAAWIVCDVFTDQVAVVAIVDYLTTRRATPEEPTP